jgi:hypothetical protein
VRHEPPAPGRALRGLWLLAGAIAFGAAARALTLAVMTGFRDAAGVEIAVPVGLAALLIGAAIEGPRPRLVQWVLIVLSGLVIVLGGTRLVSRGFAA